MSALTTRLAEKKSELLYLQQLQASSKGLVEELEELARKMEGVSGGAQAVAELMANWASILHALKLSSSALSKYAEKDYENTSNPPLPETLVRIKLDETDA